MGDVIPFPKQKVPRTYPDDTPVPNSAVELLQEAINDIETHAHLGPVTKIYIAMETTRMNGSRGFPSAFWAEGDNQHDQMMWAGFLQKHVVDFMVAVDLRPDYEQEDPDPEDPGPMVA